MRLLDGPGPQVHLGELVVSAVPREDLARLPRLQRERECLAVALAMLHRGDAIAEIHVHRAAERQSGDQPAAADAVEHGVFFGYADRGVRGRQCRAHLHDRHVRAIGQLREHAAHDVRTGHETVRVLVVFVRADAVEAALRRIEQLVDRPIVVLTHAPRVGEIPPRRRDPHGFVAGLEVERQLTMRHEVEHTDLHACPPFNTTYARYAGAPKACPRAPRSPIAAWIMSLYAGWSSRPCAI